MHLLVVGIAIQTSGHERNPRCDGSLAARISSILLRQSMIRALVGNLRTTLQSFAHLPIAHTPFLLFSRAVGFHRPDQGKVDDRQDRYEQTDLPKPTLRRWVCQSQPERLLARYAYVPSGLATSQQVASQFPIPVFLS